MRPGRTASPLATLIDQVFDRLSLGQRRSFRGLQCPPCPCEKILGYDPFGWLQYRHRSPMSRDEDAVTFLNPVQERAEMRFGLEGPDTRFAFNHIRLV